MKRIVAMVLGPLVSVLAWTGVGQAQGSIQVQGIIHAVDCQTSAFVLSAPDGTHVFPTTPNATVFINSIPSGFCALSPYVGSHATVWVMAVDSKLVVGRVDVSTAATSPAPPTYPSPPPASYPQATPVYYPPPGYYSYPAYYPYPIYYAYPVYYPYYPPFVFSIGIGFVFHPGFHHRMVFIHR